MSCILDDKNGVPLLSVLIPAYQYVEGIERIVDNMGVLSPDDCEVIVFDDSPDDVIGMLLNHSVTWCGGIDYHHNSPAKGAVANWNALLDAARGQYCLLMHHDEFPLGVHVMQRVVECLRENPETDVLMLDCILVGSSGYARRHVPTWLRRVVVSRFPEYLFRRNVIGPTASLVVRRSLYARFDVRLKWLVDVDVYVQVLRRARNILVCSNLGIGSVLNRADSITARLGASIPRILDEERAYLRDSHNVASCWLGAYPSESVIYKLLRALEAVSWLGLRIWGRVCARFFLKPMSRSVAQPILFPRHD